MTIDLRDENEMKIEETGEKKKKKKKEKKEKKEEEKIPLGRVFGLNKPEIHYIVIGCVFSLISGAVQPAFSILLAKAVGVSFILN